MRRLTKTEVSEKEYIEAGETSQIEEAAKCLRDKLLIRLLRRLGARISEVLGLEEKHIDFKERRVRIEHEKIRLALNCPFCAANGDKVRLGKKALFCPKCGEHIEHAITKKTNELHLRKLPIDQDTLELIREYIKAGGIVEVKGKRKLFNMSRQWAWKIVVDCAERAGFAGLINPSNDKQHHVSPHKFRDAFAINALKKKTSFDDARILQEILGHASINTTMRYRKVAMTEVGNFYDEVIKGD